MGAEDDPRDPSWNVGPDFPQSLSETANQGHAQRPSPLNGFYVLTNKFSVRYSQIFKPITDRFPSIFLSEEIDQ